MIGRRTGGSKQPQPSRRDWILRARELALPVGELRLQVLLRDRRAVHAHGREPRVGEQDRLQLLDHLFRERRHECSTRPKEKAPPPHLIR